MIALVSSCDKGEKGVSVVRQSSGGAAALETRNAETARQRDSQNQQGATDCLTRCLTAGLLARLCGQLIWLLYRQAEAEPPQGGKILGFPLLASEGPFRSRSQMQIAPTLHPSLTTTIHPSERPNQTGFSRPSSLEQSFSNARERPLPHASDLWGCVQLRKELLFVFLPLVVVFTLAPPCICLIKLKHRPGQNGKPICC